MIRSVPHLRVVVAVCTAAILGYAFVSWWVVFRSSDVALKGDVIGTWKSFAVLAFGFWLGSSSGGKAKSSEPVKTEVVNPPSEPVPVSGGPAPELPRPRFGRAPAGENPAEIS